MRNIRENLRRLRGRLGLTQQALAELACMDYNYYQKIESGRWEGLRVRTVERLAEALEVGAWELLAPCPSTPPLPPGRPAKKNA